VLTSIAIATGFAVGGQAACAESDDVRAVITKSLPYIEQEGVSWINKKDCVSCHRVSFMTWALDEASRHGFEVAPETTAKWQKWSREKSISKREKTDELVGAKNLEGLSQIVWSERNRIDDSTPQLVSLIVAGQDEDGSWKAGGQLPSQKRPAAETSAVSTAWNALALGSGKPTEEAQAARSRALEFLSKQSDGVSTEWYVSRLLLAAQTPDGDVDEWRKKLLEQQHDDGGWGWLVKDESDALATGMAVYGLMSTGTTADDPAIRKAVALMCSTQNENGTWSVRGTKKNRKSKIAETATYWGTCWATIGLMATLTSGSN